eukprot:750495-Hanusia_phi.AAC.3
MGAQWGLGHSTGLLIMYAIFRALDGSINLDKTGHFVDTVRPVANNPSCFYACAHKMRRSMRQNIQEQTFFSSTDELLEKEVERGDGAENLDSWVERDTSCQVEDPEISAHSNNVSWMLSKLISHWCQAEDEINVIEVEMTAGIVSQALSRSCLTVVREDKRAGQGSDRGSRQGGDRCALGSRNP